jgi:homocysteine S-methyltransferase
MHHQSQSTVVLLDGGLGQEISRRSSRPEAHSLWSIMVMREDPQTVIDVHQDFLLAGARVLTLNNYTATPSRLARVGMESELAHIHHHASHLLDQAIEMSGLPRSAISKMGCLPPLVASYVADVAPDYDSARREYEQLIAVQVNYVDGFLIETMSNVTEMSAARDALVAANQQVRIGMTLEDSSANRLRSGERLSVAIKALAEGPLDSVMINCSKPETIPSALSELAKLGCPYGAYANGFKTIAPLRPGGTVKDLEYRDELNAEAYTGHVLKWLESGATIVGGCCEITPLHIKHLHQALLDRNILITSF